MAKYCDVISIEEVSMLSKRSNQNLYVEQFEMPLLTLEEFKQLLVAIFISCRQFRFLLTMISGKYCFENDICRQLFKSLIWNSMRQLETARRLFLQNVKNICMGYMEIYQNTSIQCICFLKTFMRQYTKKEFQTL